MKTISKVILLLFIGFSIAFILAFIKELQHQAGQSPVVMISWWFPITVIIAGIMFLRPGKKKNVDRDTTGKAKLPEDNPLTTKTPEPIQIKEEGVNQIESDPIPNNHVSEPTPQNEEMKPDSVVVETEQGKKSISAVLESDFYERIDQLEEELKANLNGLSALFEKGLLNDAELAKKKEQANKTFQNTLDKIDAEIDREWEQNGVAILKESICKEKCDLLKDSYSNKLLTKEEFDQKENDLLREEQEKIRNTITELNSLKANDEVHMQWHKKSLRLRNYINGQQGNFEGNFTSKNLINMYTVGGRLVIWPTCVVEITKRY